MQYLKKERSGKCGIKGDKWQSPSHVVYCWFDLLKLSIFGVIPEKHLKILLIDYHFKF